MEAVRYGNPSHGYSTIWAPNVARAGVDKKRLRAGELPKHSRLHLHYSCASGQLKGGTMTCERNIVQKESSVAEQAIG
jgi:hypothetical protein